MITSADLKTGTYFVGTVCRELFRDHKTVRMDGLLYRHIGLDAVKPTVTVHGDATSAREVMEMFRALPWDHPYQTSEMWIAGVRKRGYVRILGWGERKYPENKPDHHTLEEARA